MFNNKALITVVFSLGLFGCEQAQEQISIADPVKLTVDDVGHFCGMLVVNHKGPKGQVFLNDGTVDPLWFVSARDSLAYSRMPDEEFKVSVIYVSDMGKAASWDDPGDDAWVKAEDAWYVEGSSRTGGMGMAEWVPFSDKAKAEAFVAEFGGSLVQLDSIDTDDLLGEDEAAMDMTDMSGMDHSSH